ncbi:MAG: hypothetical protein K0S41_1030 [Anaerocolumna sp.]|nr:hypothetical protein [Anaerocolumna sp.]
MSIRENNENLVNKIRLHNSEHSNEKPDKKLQKIYERYHNGKTIIMDDLKYLCLKDPEGCNILIKNIIEPNIINSNKIESNMDSKIGDVNNTGLKSTVKNQEESKKQQFNNDSALIDDTEYRIKNSLEIMSSIKLEIEKMNELEKMDMLNHLYKTIELIKLSQNMKYWDDKFNDKMIMYTYGEEKEFNILA